MEHEEKPIRTALVRIISGHLAHRLPAILVTSELSERILLQQHLEASRTVVVASLNDQLQSLSVQFGFFSPPLPLSCGDLGRFSLLLGHTNGCSPHCIGCCTAR